MESEAAAATRAVLQCLVDAGVTDIQTSRPSLEEVYFREFGDRAMRA